MDDQYRLDRAIEQFDLADYVNKQFLDVLPANDAELRINCFSPNGCAGSDTKKHLWINTDKKKWICYKCGYGDPKTQKGTGNLVRFIADAENIYVSEAKNRLLNQVEATQTGDLDILLEEAFDKYNQVIPKEEPKQLRLPLRFHSIWNSRSLTAKRFQQYLIQRRFSTEAQKQFDIRFCISPIKALPKEQQKLFLNRIVWPIYDREGVCRSAVGRSIEVNAQRRYVNWPKTNLNHYFWPLSVNYYGKQIPYELGEHVILTEGIADAYAIQQLTPYKALACFGKKLSDPQVDLLCRLNIKSVTLAWDFEAKDKMIYASKRLIPKFDQIDVFPFEHPAWPLYDFGDALKSITLQETMVRELRSTINVLSPQFCAWAL